MNPPLTATELTAIRVSCLTHISAVGRVTYHFANRLYGVDLMIAAPPSLVAYLQSALGSDIWSEEEREMLTFALAYFSL